MQSILQRFREELFKAGRLVFVFGACASVATAQLPIGYEVLKTLPKSVDNTSFATINSKGSTIITSQSLRANGGLPKATLVATANDAQSWATVFEGESAVGDALIQSYVTPSTIFSPQNVLGIRFWLASAYNTSWVFQSDIRRTTDGGATWRELIASSKPVGANDYNVISRLVSLNISEWFAVEQNYLFNRNGGVWKSTLLVTKDGGTTWERRAIPEAMGKVEEIRVISSSLLYAYTLDATTNTVKLLSKSFDGGISWILMPNPGNSTNIIRAIDFSDAVHGIAVGGRIIQDDDPQRLGSGSNTQFTQAIYRTNDGGLTWETVVAERDGIPLTTIDIVNDTLSIARSNSEAFSSFDAGTSWNSITLINDPTRESIIASTVDRTTGNYLYSWNSTTQQQLVRFTPKPKQLAGGTTSVQENSASLLALAPNPAQQSVRVYPTDDIDSPGNRFSAVSIVNALGVTMLTIQEPTSDVIDVSFFANGAYFLRATTTGGKTIIKPFVIDR